ncbi:hypothetical protein L1987_83264 [Smallanthus sonchifolius]|uniref:Uncharacterized protein n=1 Tax=Smallanthus sonchifolius TaxID=185202 RepID=A0ACB8YBQ9_9ASTR|nr:hypothetical protein L1987_83264 [Smallanthus sonchifolius]
MRTLQTHVCVAPLDYLQNGRDSLDNAKSAKVDRRKWLASFVRLLTVTLGSNLGDGVTVASNFADSFVKYDSSEHFALSILLYNRDWRDRLVLLWFSRCSKVYKVKIPLHELMVSYTIFQRLIIGVYATVKSCSRRTEKGILRKWNSRFDAWPYLEKFSEDAASEISAELHGAPDLIIGNYSDGNLVASLLSYKMSVTQILTRKMQCNIAHALEKTKYRDSDLYRKKSDEKYHFSCQLK